MLFGLILLSLNFEHMVERFVVRTVNQSRCVLGLVDRWRLIRWWLIATNGRCSYSSFGRARPYPTSFSRTWFVLPRSDQSWSKFFRRWRTACATAKRPSCTKSIVCSHESCLPARATSILANRFALFSSSVFVNPAGTRCRWASSCSSRWPTKWRS